MEKLGKQTEPEQPIKLVKIMTRVPVHLVPANTSHSSARVATCPLLSGFIPINKENEVEQKGYDAWIEIWVSTGCEPTARDCPARWLPEGSCERSQFIKGWNRARNENFPRDWPNYIPT